MTRIGLSLSTPKSCYVSFYDFQRNFYWFCTDLDVKLEMDSDRMSDFRERGSIFKQMAEMKKKIQLVNTLMTSQKCF